MAERKRRRPPGAAHKPGRKLGSRKKGIVSQVNPLGLAPEYMLLVDKLFECGFNRKEATLQAGFANESGGYTDRLFKRPDVQAEIIRRQNAGARIHEISKELLVERMDKVAHMNVGMMIKKLQDAEWNLDCLSEDELYMVDALDIEISLIGRGEEKVAIKKIKFKPQNRQGAATLVSRLEGWMAKDGDDDGDIINEIYEARPDLKVTTEQKQARKEAQEQQKRQHRVGVEEEQDDDQTFGPG